MPPFGWIRSLLRPEHGGSDVCLSSGILCLVAYARTVDSAMLRNFATSRVVHQSPSGAPGSGHGPNITTKRCLAGGGLDIGTTPKEPLKSQIVAGSLDMRSAVRRDQRLITTLSALVSAARPKVS